MKYLITCLLVGLALSAAGVAQSHERYPFSQSSEQKRFNDLSQRLRCLVCQNESIMDSTAPLAVDLRTQVYQMVRAGQTNAQIENYLVNRYGEFILFKPPFMAKTALLWGLPLLFLIWAMILWRRSFVYRGGIKSSQEEKEAVERLLNANSKEG